MNRNLIRLGNAIKNTDTSKLSEVQKEHFNQLKADYIRALNSPNSKDFNEQDLANLLNNSFKLEEYKSSYQTKPGESYSLDNFNVILKPLSRANDPLLTHKLPNFKDIPKSNPYTHEKIPHYKSIIGFTLENGETNVLVTNWTTTDRPVQNVIQGTKLGETIDPQHLYNLRNNKDPQLINYSKNFKKGVLDYKIKWRLSVKRDNSTWAAGEYGDKNLIPVGTTTLKGKTEIQYATLVVQKYPLKDFGRHFTIDINDIPPLHFKETILNNYKNLKSLNIFNPLTKNYEEIDIDYINFVDPSKLSLELKDLKDPIKFEDHILLANIKGKTLEDYYKEKGLLEEIDPITQDLIIKEEKFELPIIEGPKDPGL